MKLLLAIPYFAPAYAFGGSVTVAETIVEDLVAAGHDVTVVTTDVFDEHRRLGRDDPPGVPGAQVVRFPNVSHRAAAGGNLYLPRGLRAWLRARAAEFDVALLQDVYSAVSVQTARACAAADVPYVVQALGTLSPARERGRPLAKQAFLRAWGRRTLDEAGALLCCTAHERQEHLDVGVAPSKLVTLPLPLDLPSGNDELRAEAPTVAFVGRLHPIKRIDTLIEAVALVRAETPDVRLDIVGPGDRHGDELRALAARLGVADAVRFHGYVSVADKLRVLRRAHVSALLSAGEGLPMAALESMACGTPVVLSEACHFPEAHGRGGLVVAGDADDAAEALQRLLGDAKERERLGAGARELAGAFRREVVVPQVVELLQHVAVDGRRGPAGARRRRRRWGL